MAVKLPLEFVRTGSGFAVVPSQVVSSIGRFAVVPPGSAHSMMLSPEGSAVRFGNPVPVMVIVWPSVNGPAGTVTAGPDTADAWPGMKATTAAAANRTRPTIWKAVHVRRRAHTRSTEAVTSGSLSEKSVDS